MGLGKTMRNIWKIDDLRKRIFITIGFVAVYRFGSFVILPGISPEALLSLRTNASAGLLSLVDMFSGGAFSNASIFALGIMPYITASIVMQLLALCVPSLQKMQREGESGYTKLNQYTRYLTIIILLIQGPAYLYGALGKAIPGGFWSWVFPATLILTGGGMFVMWLGERITDRGIGNGISFIILVGILARLPHALAAEVDRLINAPGGLILLILELLVLALINMFAIMLVQGVRKVPVQYAKRIIGNRQYGGVRQYIPLKVNAANVMPIIFAQAIMFIPITIARFTIQGGKSFWAQLMNMNSFWYNLIFAVLIILFTYFYTAVTINPMQMAEDLKRNNGFIPGVKPGKKTAEYIDTIMSRITLPGSFLLALISILPTFVRLCGVNQMLSQFFGGTSLLIIVGVVLDTLQQIESFLLMRHYDGFLKTGSRIKGRTGSMASY